jgi:hypothetical protein
MPSKFDMPRYLAMGKNLIRRFCGNELVVVAVISLLFTGLFFLEYLPPIERVHMFSDIEGYHYPLLHYAFITLQHGHLPEWDPTIYCGLSLVGNVQAALLYPPNWLMFALNFHRRHLSYMGLQILVMLHMWLAFMFCYLWFRNRRLVQLASILGGGVYAFSGYMMSQNNHVGVATGMTWTPFALWGIDQALERRSWRPLWKVAAASALCFLAGFTPTWFVFCFIVAIYALVRAGRHWGVTAATAAALVFSLLLSAVQLLPAMDASSMKNFEPHFGNGVQEWEFYLSYFIPNYFDLERGLGWGAPPGVYMYLGAAALVALAWLVIRRNFRAHLPALAIIAGCSFFLANVNGSAWQLVQKNTLLAQVCRGFNFLEGLAIAAALITAVSLDDLLKRSLRPLPRWLLWVAAAALLAWSARLFVIWLPGGADFAGHWASAADSAIMVVLLALGCLVYRASAGRRRAVVAVIIVLAVGMEYKTFGASRRFSAWNGAVDKEYGWTPFPGIDEAVYREIWAHREYRLALDESVLQPTHLRHYELTSPQGFDPFLTAQYRRFIESYVSFSTDRLFYMAPEQQEMLRGLAVRYFITKKDRPSFVSMLASPDFRQLKPWPESDYAVFEFLKAEPPYGFDAGSGRDAAGVEKVAWHAGRRTFRTNSATGGRFVLVEQFFPGWHATVDGRPVPIERWHQAFQAIEVPPGSHRVSFEFRSGSLRLGAVISIVALAGLIALAAWKRKA